jgi:GDSL-like Lipase/Acylhydrolase family
MRSGTVLGLALLLAAVAAGTPLRAEDAQQAPSSGAPQTDAPQAAPATQGSIEGCDVPDNLLATDSVLQKVAEVVKAGKPIDILVIGSRSSTIPQSEGSAYPARMQAALKEALPLVKVNLSVEIQAKTTAEDAAGAFAKLLEEKKPTLVVWQTGTVDAMRSVDPDDFHNAVDAGVVALQNAGADVILMNPQYSPRTETMISLPPYIDNLRAVAQQHDIPLFDRFAIMHQWNDDGEFDLFSTSHGPGLAKRVHDCLGRALSKFVIDAAHIGPTQQN